MKFEDEGPDCTSGRSMDFIYNYLDLKIISIKLKFAFNPVLQKVK